MKNYSFEETISFFEEKFQTVAPREDIENKNVELLLDEQAVMIVQGMTEGSLHMSLTLGFLLRPIPEKKMKELATSNFLGMDTGGSVLALDRFGSLLSLHCYTTCQTTPQENWEWLHRLLGVAHEWNQRLTQWEEFVPINQQQEERKDDSTDHKQSAFRV